MEDDQQVIQPGNARPHERREAKNSACQRGGRERHSGQSDFHSFYPGGYHGTQGDPAEAKGERRTLPVGGKRSSRDDLDGWSGQTPY